MKIHRKKIAILLALVCAIAGGYFTYQSMIFRDNTKSFPDQCPIHNVAIISKRIKNSGFSHIDPDYFYVKSFNEARKDFKYSGREIWGTGIPNKWVRWIDKRYCPTCLEMQQKWQTEWWIEERARRDSMPKN
jgi:hypothetical protein